MRETTSSYSGHRFPAEVISHAVWLYHRFSLSFRDVEDLLAERGVQVSYETIRRWSQRLGAEHARRLKKRERPNDIWHLDEMFIRINGEQHDLWRAVDQEGDTIDILVQKRRDAGAAKRFFRKLLKLGRTPRELATDKLGSHSIAHRTLLPSVAHVTRRWANNRAEDWCLDLLEEVGKGCGIVGIHVREDLRDDLALGIHTQVYSGDH